MAKIYFYYGTMKSSKTAQILMRAHNYTEADVKITLAKPSIDTRTNTMWSRVGLEAPCVTTEELFELDDTEIKKNKVIIIDEAQFLTAEAVDKLAHFADDLNVIVMCYGLKTDSNGHLFPGSKRLFEIANEIKKLETTCWCGEEAEFNAYVENGKVQDNPKNKAGVGVDLPDDRYHPLCRKHFFDGKWKK